ncbi:hypothetical protein DQ400_19845, partial [Vreelandella sulfidaeris]
MIITPVVDDLFILAVVFETKLNLKIKTIKKTPPIGDVKSYPLPELLEHHSNTGHHSSVFRVVAT